MSAPARAPDPTADDWDEPMLLAEPGAGDVAAVAVLATRPAPSLPHPDERLLARFVENLDRQLLRAAPGPARDVIMDLLCRLVPVAGDVPVGEGIGLVATTNDAVLLHLRGPVRDRAVAHTTPTDAELGVRPWPGDPLAIVVVGAGRVRLLVRRHGLLREETGAGFPLRRDPFLPLPDELARVDERLAGALDADLPIVVAGLEPVAAAFRDRSALADRIVGVLPGDQSHAPPAALLALADRLPARLTAAQRRAVADLIVARLHGRVVSGPAAVRRALPAIDDPYVVVEAGLLDPDDVGDPDGALAEEAVLAALAGRGRVTIVPHRAAPPRRWHRRDRRRARRPRGGDEVTTTVAALFGSARTAARAVAAVEAQLGGVRASTHVLPPGPDAGARFVSARIGSLTARAAAAGAVVVGTLAGAVCALAYDGDRATVACVALALGVTAGLFFGSLCGFALGMHRWDPLRDPLSRMAAGGGGWALATVRTADPDAASRLLAGHEGRLVG